MPGVKDILVVDDSRTELVFLRSLLTRNGYHVRTAENAEQALLELGEQREALLAVTIPEEKGSFLKFCQLLGGRSVTEFNYRFADAKDACIFVGVRLSRGVEERKEILSLRSLYLMKLFLFS